MAAPVANALHDFQAVIHGQGVVALSAALVFAKLGIPSKFSNVADATHPSTSSFNSSDVVKNAADIRAFALSDASQKFLRNLGVWQHINPAACTPVRKMCVFDLSWGHAAAGVKPVVFEQLLDEPLNHIVEHDALLTALNAALQRSEEGEIHAKGAERIANGQTPRPPTVSVICEGRNSPFRNALAARGLLKEDNHLYRQTAVAGLLKAQKPHHGTAWQWFVTTPLGLEVLALLPRGGMEGSSYAMVWSCPNAKSKRLAQLSTAQFDLELQHTLVQCAMAPHGLSLTASLASWPLHLHLATPWWGKVPEPWLLLGDSAHSLHPLAGQGLNLGLGDLAKLQALLQQQAPWRRQAYGLGDAQLLGQWHRGRCSRVQAVQSAVDGLFLAFQNPMSEGSGVLQHAAPIWGKVRGIAQSSVASWPAALQNLQKLASL